MAVSGSGTPRNVLGTASRKVWVTSALIMATATIAGPNTGTSAAPAPRRIPAMVLAWIPGMRPLAVPSSTPTSDSGKNVPHLKPERGGNGDKSIETNTVIRERGCQG